MKIYDIVVKVEPWKTIPGETCLVIRVRAERDSFEIREYFRAHDFDSVFDLAVASAVRQIKEYAAKK